MAAGIAAQKPKKSEKKPTGWHGFLSGLIDSLDVIYGKDTWAGLDPDEGLKIEELWRMIFDGSPDDVSSILDSMGKKDKDPVIVANEIKALFEKYHPGYLENKPDHPELPGLGLMTPEDLITAQSAEQRGLGGSKTAAEGIGQKAAAIASALGIGLDLINPNAAARPLGDGIWMIADNAGGIHYAREANGGYERVSAIEAEAVGQSDQIDQIDWKVITGEDGNVIFVDPDNPENVVNTGIKSSAWAAAQAASALGEKEFKHQVAQDAIRNQIEIQAANIRNRLAYDESNINRWKALATNDFNKAEFNAGELYRASTEARANREFDASIRLEALAQQENARATNIQTGFQIAELRQRSIDQARDILSQPADYLARGFALAGQESPFGEVTQADLLNKVSDEYNAYTDYLQTFGTGFNAEEYLQKLPEAEPYAAQSYAGFEEPAPELREPAALQAPILPPGQGFFGPDTTLSAAMKASGKFGKPFTPEEAASYIAWVESGGNPADWPGIVAPEPAAAAITPPKQSPLATGAERDRMVFGLGGPNVGADPLPVVPPRGNVAADLLDPRKQAEEQAIYNPSFNVSPPVPVIDPATGQTGLPQMRGGGVTGFGNPVVVGDSRNGRENQELVMSFGAAPVVVLPLTDRQEDIMAKANNGVPRAQLGGGFGFQDFGNITGFGGRVGDISMGGFSPGRLLRGGFTQSEIMGMPGTPRVSQVAAGRRPTPMQFGPTATSVGLEGPLMTPGMLASLAPEEYEELRTRLGARNISLGTVERAVQQQYGPTGARRGRRRF